MGFDQIFFNTVYEKDLKNKHNHSNDTHTIIYNTKYRDTQSEHSLLIQQITKDEARKHSKNLEQMQKEFEGLFGLTF